MRTSVQITTCILGATLLCLPAIAHAQACQDFHKRACATSTNPQFVYNSQSKSALFIRGHVSQMFVVLYAGQDYRVTMCAEDKLGTPSLRVSTPKKSEVLVDWTPGPQEFSVTSTQRLVLEVKTPGPAPVAKEGASAKLSAEHLGCLGVLIEQMPTPKAGF